MNTCMSCGSGCKNKFCSISCRNVFWNGKLKRGIPHSNPPPKKDRITETRICKCGEVFKVTGTLAQLTSNKSRSFCSRRCANSRKFTDATNRMRSMNMLARTESTLKVRLCKQCNTRIGRARSRHLYCSDVCRAASDSIRFANKDQIHSYRLNCKFKFNPYHYPEILNTNLLTLYGFYSPINKKNNLGGVSMDHKLSIRDGFDLNIDPYYMSHIMNCDLLIHNKNIGKGRKSTITWSELKVLVDEYDLLKK